MTTTPISKVKLSCRIRRNRDTEGDSPVFIANSPKHKNTMVSDDYSPIYFPSTQESEDMVVSWDWNSPQAAHKKRRKQKRLIPAPSPKCPLKRYPSNNQTENFERLRNELKALQEELALPDDETCLCISPQQEVEIKEGHRNNLCLEDEDLCDIFNDSLDEQLVIFSQQIEDEMTQSDKRKNVKKPVVDINQLNNNFNDLASPTLPQNVIQTASGKLEFYRTKSFEQTVTGNSETIMEEIERKRQEAKAKLESKIKISQISKCSPEEIEQKRLQARAKLEAKRIQEIVEKKRQEALKKRQQNLMKNASQVRSTLTKRL